MHAAPHFYWQTLFLCMLYYMHWIRWCLCPEKYNNYRVAYLLNILPSFLFHVPLWWLLLCSPAGSSQGWAFCSPLGDHVHNPQQCHHCSDTLHKYHGPRVPHHDGQWSSCCPVGSSSAWTLERKVHNQPLHLHLLLLVLRRVPCTACMSPVNEITQLYSNIICSLHS